MDLDLTMSTNSAAITAFTRVLNIPDDIAVSTISGKNFTSTTVKL